VNGCCCNCKISQVIRRSNDGSHYTVEVIKNVKATPNGLQIEIAGEKNVGSMLRPAIKLEGLGGAQEQTPKRHKVVPVSGVVTVGNTALLTSAQVEEAYRKLRTPEPTPKNLTRVVRRTDGMRGVLITGQVQKRYAESYGWVSSPYTIIDERGVGYSGSLVGLMERWRVEE
jgi:hypothetical protein